MADKTVKYRICLRNDTKEAWRSANPVLLKGEIGIETDTRLFKFGDGTKAWNELKYADTEHAVLKTASPTNADSGYSIGTKWINTTNNTVYLCFGNTPEAAVWKQVAMMENLANLGAGDMLKSTFATIKPEEGYVDKAVNADTATKLSAPKNITLTGDATGSASFDGSAEASIAVTLKNSGVTGGTYTKVTVDSKGIVKKGENLTAEDIPTGISSDKIEGLGTAAKANTGTTNGTVPVIGENNKLSIDLIPDLTLSKITDAKSAASKDVGTGAGNVPILGVGGKLDENVIPSIAITDTFEADSDSAMIALSEAKKGDICVRSDVSKTYILKTEPYSTLKNWVELRTPTDAVLSVNGKTGAVTLNTDEVSEGSTNLYYTEARASANFKTHASTELTDKNDIMRYSDTITIDCGGASAK